jgi:hypothetical protein
MAKLKKDGTIDRRSLNRGAKGVSGRKSKAEEQNLIEKLTPLEPLALAKLKESMEDGESWAIKMFFEYFNGRPMVNVRQETTITEQPLFNLDE